MANRTSITRNILIATNIITLGLAIYFYSQADSTGDDTQPVVCCSYEDLEGETLEDFTNVIKRYKDNAWTIINTTMNQQLTSSGGSPTFEDARCIWFSMDSIKQFICTIEKYSEQLDLTTANLGIRLYYGQYPDAHPNYPNRHTIFMMPTFNPSDNGPAIDFDPRYNVINNWGATSVDSIRSFTRGITSVSPSPTTLFTVLGGDLNMNPNIRNSGELCPPKCVPAGQDNTFTFTDR